MSFIEGVGDEVTAFFVILVVVALAALVTFIGNGSHLYSTTSITINTRRLPVDSTTNQNFPELAQAYQTIQSDISIGDPAESNRNSYNPNDLLRVVFRSRGNRHQDITSNETSQTENPNAVPLQTNRNPPRPYSWTWSTGESNRVPIHEEETEEISEDTEDQNSSDETRATETHPENQECETPTAPTEEACSEDPEQPTTESTSVGIRIRLKYLDDTERTVRSIPTASIGEFKRNHFSEDLANNKIVRLIFCGHLLRDTSTLESYRVIDNSVIHVQILQAQTDQNRSPVSQNIELDLSVYLWALVSIILGVCWLFYLKHPEFFNLLSISLLFLFTSGFVIFHRR